MIAYNHYIKFIPELENDKKVEGSFDDVVTVKESLLENLPDELVYEMDYINNQGRNLKFYTDREFSRTAKEQLWAFEVKGVVTFIWCSGTLILEYIPHKNFTEELLEYWCLHIVLPMFFTIEEIYAFLHAGAVEMEGKPIMFIAESYGGKSTITDYFIKKGHVLISDDKVATIKKNHQFFAISSHPHQRPYRNTEDLGFFVKNFSTNPQPIHVIYKLQRVTKNEKVIIDQLQGMEKFKYIRQSSEMNLPFQRMERFKYLTDISNSILMYKVSVPWDFKRLDEVYSCIVAHSRALKGRR